MEPIGRAGRPALDEDDVRTAGVDDGSGGGDVLVDAHSAAPDRQDAAHASQQRLLPTSVEGARAAADEPRPRLRGGGPGGGPRGHGGGGGGGGRAARRGPGRATPGPPSAAPQGWPPAPPGASPASPFRPRHRRSAPSPR